MEIPGDKQLICLTGSVWSGSRSAPRKLFVRDGFVRPNWFTTERPIQDAAYELISESEFHLANAEHRVLAHIEYGGSFVGIFKESLLTAIGQAKRGALVVCPPEIAAQIAAQVKRVYVFSLKEKAMTLSPHLQSVDAEGKLHRVDIDVLQPGAWSDAYRRMAETVGIPVLPMLY
ncbi:MAG: hypothetical protein KDI68_01075 [Gammaproteobacteria bacterium]|nr:hypothetical protein [Gammaproteobacteria bacterium]